MNPTSPLASLVLLEMLPYLNNSQLSHLKVVLLKHLNNVSYDSTQPTTDERDYVDSFLTAKKIEGCSERSLHYYKQTLYLMKRMVGKAIRLITTEDVRSFMATYQSEHHVSSVTLDNMRRIMSSFFGWLEDEDTIVKSPIRRIHKVKTPKTVKETYSDEELEKLRDNCDQIRDLALIDLLASTGMRVGELVRLKRTDIDFQERECVVLGKGNKSRTVYFDARTKLHLSLYLGQRKDENSALFVSLKAPHSPLSIGAVESRLRFLGEQVGMTKVHPHKFRRTLATIAIDKGMPIEQVQQLLGHQKIDTTLQYAMVKQENVKQSHRRCIA